MTAPVPVEKAFSFFEDARNLERITPPWLYFRIVTPDAIRMRAGAEIDYIIGWMGLPMKWKTIIKTYAPPRCFIDEQARGPYSLWHHEHTFEETAAGVVIRNRVNYELPMGIFGRIAHAVMVKRQLMAIFRYRQKAIAEILNVPGITFDEPRIEGRRV